MMKTKVSLTKWLVITTMLFALGYSAKAGNLDKVRMYTLEGKKVLIETVNPQQQAITVTIENSKTEEVVYSSDPAYKDYFRKYYDLTSLPEANYKISVKIDNQVFEKEIQLNSDVPVLLAETTYYEPVFLLGDKSMEVMVLNPEKAEVLVTFRKNSESFFKDEPGNYSLFKRKYNLQDLEPGQYQVELTSGDKYYSHSFDIK